MRKPFLLSLLVALLTTLSLHAYDFQSGDLYYNITSGTTVEVTYQDQGLTTATIPETVTYNGTTYSVTSIGERAFSKCSSLTSITIPNSVTSIGKRAFSRCSSLTSIVVESGNIVFDSRDNCNAIIETATNTLIAGCQSTTIPNSVTSIGDDAFNGCSSLTSITIPNSVTSIGGGAFYNCSSLTSITIPNSVTSIGGSAFYGCSNLTSITIPESVTSIGNKVFSGCSNLTSITIPNSVTSIGDYAFSYCSSLTSITIPNSVTSIGRYAFDNVPNIVYNGTTTGSPWGARSVNGYVDGYFVYADDTKTTLLACSAAATGEVTLPNSVTSIGDNAFNGCSSLTSITLPNSVTSIGEWAFEGCSSLTSITIPNSVTNIGSGAFYKCSSLTSITLPNSVTSIEYRAFSGCSNLTSITIPNSVTSIGGSAFYDCSSLTSITIPNSVTSIGGSAFYDCSSLTSITIPNSVTSIGDHAFYNVLNIVYSGTATGSPWGARSVNGYVDGYLVYTDETKTTLSTCSTKATGEVTLPNSVTSIGNSAFSGCSNLTSITIPESVTSIGNSAFSGCSALTSITIPNSVTSIGDYAFYNVLNIMYIGTATGSPWGAKSVNGYVEGYLVYADDTKTTLLACSAAATGEIILPNSVTSIGYGAFEYCSSLTSIILPNSVTSIGGCAFQDCSSLTSITIPNSVTSIGGSAFRECSSLTSITLPNSVTSIGGGAFQDCYSLTSITIGNSVTSIGDWAFGNCFSLTSITLPNSVTSIGSCAFAECSALTSITLGNSVTSIGDWAFSGCSALTSISIPNSVTSIGRSAFGGCSSLTSITLPNSVTSIGENAFYDCSSLTSVTIGNSVTSIGSSAFNGCYSLTSVTIPNSVTSIGDNAFYDVLNVVYNGTATGSPWGARSVNGYVDGYFVYADDTKTHLLACSAAATGEITLPNSVTSIGDEAFRNCSGLTEFTIPENITYLGDQVFEGCSGITSITWNARNCQDRWKDLYYYSQLPFYDIYSQISSFTFGETVDSIPSFLCYEMSNLSSITIPENVKHIGGGVFSNCTGLTSVVWNAINCSNDVGDGSGSIWPIFTYSNAHITSFTLGEKVEVIPGALCYGLSELTSITIPNSVKTIGRYAFRDCSGLTAIGIPENVTSIEYSTFSGCTALASVIIPSSVTMIDEYAFGECLKLRDVYCYPATPPTAQINSFANYDVYVHVPCASLDTYDTDVVFGSFKYVECIGAEDTVITDKTVTVVPGDADATFTWPVTDNADTYSLVITKDGVTFCTLVFNAQGQLVSIAFKPRRQNAPAAEGTTPATYAEMTANGFRFTVTGLDEGTAYAYTLTVRNAANTVLETYTGEFTTLSNIPTGINESADEDAHGQVEKIIRDGQVLIIRNGETYDLMGQRL